MTQQPPKDLEREAFEKWCSTKTKNLKCLTFPLAASIYEDGYVQAAWESWQARAAQSPLDDYRRALRDILYPGGVKHPQQSEWYWLLEKVRELAQDPLDVREAAQAMLNCVTYGTVGYLGNGAGPGYKALVPEQFVTDLRKAISSSGANTKEG